MQGCLLPRLSIPIRSLAIGGTLGAASLDYSIEWTFNEAGLKGAVNSADCINRLRRALLQWLP